MRQVKNGKPYNYGLGIAGLAVVGGLLTAAMLFIPDYDRPPIDVVQNGFRGVAMEQVYNPRRVAEEWAENQIPAPPMPLVTAGPKASEVYENVQVLGDLSQTQFTRLMLAITAWVSPQQGCTYCHQEGEGFAADTLYTKRVSRWMIQMTQHINNEWQDHVAETGVTCYTCHRGNNIPVNVWWEDPKQHVSMLGYARGLDLAAMQNVVNPQAEFASLPTGSFSAFLLGDDDIRVLRQTSLPTESVQPQPGGDGLAGTKRTELTYALMMHMAGSLGVNCTFCHNTRSMGVWADSPPQRMTAWYGIRMTRELNVDYMEPTTPVLPPFRLGELGDAPKANCATCHQGVYKPMFGQSMLQDYPSLAAAPPHTREELLPGLLDAATSMQFLASQQPATDAAAPATDAAAPATTAPATTAPATTAPATDTDAATTPPANDTDAATTAPATTPPADATTGDQSDAAPAAPAAPATTAPADGTTGDQSDAAPATPAPATDGTDTTAVTVTPQEG